MLMKIYKQVGKVYTNWGVSDDEQSYILKQASLKVARRSVHATFTTIKNLETPIIGSGPFLRSQ